MLANINQVDADLAIKIGNNLQLTPSKEIDELTLKFARQNHPNYPLKTKKIEVEKSEALSMKVKGKEGSIETRKVAFLVENGVSKKSIDDLKVQLEKYGAEAVLISGKVGKLTFKEGGTEEIQHTYKTDPSVCYDAVYTPDGDSIEKLKVTPEYFQFIEEAYMHCKVLSFGEKAIKLLEQSKVIIDEGVLISDSKDWKNNFIDLIKIHRVWDLEEKRKNILL